MRDLPVSLVVVEFWVGGGSKFPKQPFIISTDVSNIHVVALAVVSDAPRESKPKHVPCFQIKCKNGILLWRTGRRKKRNSQPFFARDTFLIHQSPISDLWTSYWQECTSVLQSLHRVTTYHPVAPMRQTCPILGKLRSQRVYVSAHGANDGTQESDHLHRCACILPC